MASNSDWPSRTSSLDSSASMAYAGDRAPCSKLRYASMVAACLAYLASRQGDNVGFYAYRDELCSAIKPGHRSGHVPRIMTELHRLTASGVAAHERAFQYLAENFRRRGLVVLISDFHEAEDDLRNGLQRFGFDRHECLVLQILDPDELDLPFGNTTRFVDSESREELITYPASVRDQYMQSMNAFLGTIRESCLEMASDYLLVSTADDLGRLLAAYLHRREAMR